VRACKAGIFSQEVHEQQARLDRPTHGFSEGLRAPKFFACFKFSLSLRLKAFHQKTPVEKERQQRRQGEVCAIIAASK
jgi:hypothetical protein